VVIDLSSCSLAVEDPNIDRKAWAALGRQWYSEAFSRASIITPAFWRIAGSRVKLLWASRPWTSVRPRIRSTKIHLAEKPLAVWSARCSSEENKLEYSGSTATLVADEYDDVDCMLYGKEGRLSADDHVAFWEVEKE
jgi:hypothetical protein